MSRRRWVYRKNDAGEIEAVEVGDDYQNTRGLTAPATDLYMDGLRATDGTDIGSRKKRAAYMRAHGLADASDYTQHLAKAQVARAKHFDGSLYTQQRREQVARAAYQIARRRK